LDLKLCYRIGKSAVYKLFYVMCAHLMEVLPLEGLPRDVKELETLSYNFKASRRKVNPLTGCVGVLDGISVKIAKPHVEERPAAYYCRKGHYA